MGVNRRFRRQRKFNAAKQTPRQSFRQRKSDFLLFFETVLGKTPIQQEIKTARKQAKQFLNEIESKTTSLERRKQIWNQIARAYTQINKPERIEAETRILSDYSCLAPKDNVTSIGSGPAILEAFIAKKMVPEGKITCIDIAEEMNRIAEQTKAKAQATNMQIITASGTQTNLPSSSQDKVIMMQTDLVNTIHWQLVLTEAKRILKKTPTARFIFSFATDKQKEVQEIIESLKRNHFDFRVIKYASAGKVEARMVIARPLLLPLSEQKP